MKVPESWLREWVHTNLGTEQISEQLTLAGLEVDEILKPDLALDGVLVAIVTAIAKHPSSENLQVCTIRVEDREHIVVCGAPNVRVGMKVAYAQVGACLPGQPEIKEVAIKGVGSEGMLCSLSELGLGETADVLAELDTDLSVGRPLASVLELSDPVFDVSLTPNRGDCFSIKGIARDLAVMSDGIYRERQIPRVKAGVESKMTVTLESPDQCSRYCCRVIEGLNVGAVTPMWMGERLRRAGLRTIHPVVDVTNYVMLELGQPMHGFDLQKLSKGVRVRMAQKGEKLVLLDGETIEMDDSTLVIADHQHAVALAGVMGGAESGVTSATTDILLESAFFDPVSLSGVARSFRLQTDASTRFERGVDPSIQEIALERATTLILEICGGVPGPVTVTEDKEKIPIRQAIKFDPRCVNETLGAKLSNQRIEEILSSLGMFLEQGDDFWKVTPPAYRSDIRISADLIEEVARIFGYDNIPTKLPRGTISPASPGSTRSDLVAGGVLIGRGYCEAITYSFISPDDFERFKSKGPGTILANPISVDMAVMRPNLFAGLVRAAAYNLNRQCDEIRLFEVGQVFADSKGKFEQRLAVGGVRAVTDTRGYRGGTSNQFNFFDVKQDVIECLSLLTTGDIVTESHRHPAMHPGQCASFSIDKVEIGLLGALHPEIARSLDINAALFMFELYLDVIRPKETSQYSPISRFPMVRRDISIVIDENVSAGECITCAKEHSGPFLKDLQLFDVYRGQSIDSGKKSISLGLIFQDVSSTLTDSEVDEVMARVLQGLGKQVGATLRK